MKKATAIFWGIVLIAIGAILILVQLDIIASFNIFRVRYLWPAFLLVLGLMFHVQYFAGGMKNPGILVPGGILLVYGCFFLYLTLSSWSNTAFLWPLFLVGPGFGLLELKLFSRGREGSWIPVFILFGLALLFFVKEGLSSFPMAIAIALIVIGAAVIIASLLEAKKKPKTKQDNEFE